MMTHIDPVCGMQVNHQNAAGWSAHQGRRPFISASYAGRKHSPIYIVRDPSHGLLEQWVRRGMLLFRVLCSINARVNQ